MASLHCSLRRFPFSLTVPQEDARSRDEASKLDATLEADGVAKIKQAHARQMLAVAADADPREEAARIRDVHHKHTVSSSDRETQPQRAELAILQDNIVQCCYLRTGNHGSSKLEGLIVLR